MYVDNLREILFGAGNRQQLQRGKILRQAQVNYDDLAPGSGRAMMASLFIVVVLHPCHTQENLRQTM